MKAIIVDDEKHVREGLVLIGDWEKYGITTIYEASDGDEAKKLIRKHHPEIIFTDMSMPKCDGIELLKWIHSSKLHLNVIVISGYDDFKYTKNSITYGSFDYLLKPINPIELDETINRAVYDWNEKNIQRLSNLQNDQVVWDYLLSGAIEKIALPQQIMEDIEKEYEINMTTEQYTMVLIPMKMLIHHKYKGDVDLAFSSVLKGCNQMLHLSKNGIAFRNLNNEEEIAFLFWHNNNITDLIGQIRSKIKQITKLDCPLIVGEQSFQLVDAYMSARNRLLKHNLLSDYVAKDNNGESVSINKHVRQLFDYTEEIKWAIQSGTNQQIGDVLSSIFHEIQTNNYFSIEQLDKWETQFPILREHWLKEYEMNKQTPLYEGYNYWEKNGRFSLQKFQEEKKSEFMDLISTVNGVHFKKEKDAVQMIGEYVRNNYQKDIKLQEIADQFYLSREHISRRFKQEFKMTITDYVTGLRIEKAKVLLGNQYLKIYQIANTVGYQNDKYFIKVFKKTVGITPNEFRISLLSKQGNARK